MAEWGRGDFGVQTNIGAWLSDTDGTKARVMNSSPAGTEAGLVVRMIGSIGSVSTSAKATAANPTYVEGTDSPISQDLSGNLRTLVSFPAVVHVDDNAGSLTVDGTFWQATQPISGTVAVSNFTDNGLTDTQLRATPVPVSGTFWQATQPVSGTFWQATQPVSLAAAVDVSDRVARLLGHVTVDNASIAVTGTFWQATQPVSGTFWQATQPVSGTVTANQGGAPWTVKGDQARASATIPNPVVVGLRAASYPTKPTAVAAGQLVDAVSDLEGVPYIRPRTLNTYTAIFRLALAAASSALAFTYVANTDKQLATIFHAVGSTKTVRLRRVWVELVTIGAVAGQLQYELRRLTVAPATGNPVITPLNRNSGGAAVEATCLALPTTGGTDVSPNSPIASKVFAVIASEAAVVSTWPAGPSTIILYDEASADDEEEPPTMRAATAEGYAVIGRSTAAVPTTFMVRMVFSEE